ncbi:MAG TPA: carbon starvation protein A [Pirellulaceae bacterium]|mgnify:CR=1 FL=1|nr:carbon starvation protein A [Pirellulaceae bacterium]HMO93175.1 carbon starvation protein A [Pirellulaceae bacterium]HMP69996.1 carbon starvation protein A [Pirellulaceae bacterium]
MSTLIVAAAAFFGFIIAYFTYGRWLSNRIFVLDAHAKVPSQELRDDIDFVPTKKSVVFGHHFTSIAGTGPIVGPAIAVFWGWLPALLWVVFGAIFIGAVHDFASLVISLRNRGQTVGQIAGRMISPRVKILFLVVLFFALTIVLGVFGLVIANIFKLYPGSVLPVWISLPIAMIVGLRTFKHGGSLLWFSIFALVIVFVCIYLGAYYFPIEISFGNPVIIWTIALLIYCFFASVLPVWLLLQPRDYVNSHLLVVALVLISAGLFVASISGQANLSETAPMITSAERLPAKTPPLLPFLCITIACGAISGFHCLVSSGTSSKQLGNETEARFVGYGAMLLEGGLAVIVILACCAGLGMGIPGTDGSILTGSAAWESKYAAASWGAFGLKHQLEAFVQGGANFLLTIGIPEKMGVGIIAVLVACFAATTLDTATRLQRYVIQELGIAFRVKPVANKYVATSIAVFCGGAVAMLPTDKGPGTGGMILWPLFGATNQLLAGLAFMVAVFYLWRRNKPIWFAVFPMLLMIILPAWALLWQIFSPDSVFYEEGQNQWVLISFAAGILALQFWMVAEALLAWKKARGVLEEALPVLTKSPVNAGRGRSC